MFFREDLFSDVKMTYEGSLVHAETSAFQDLKIYDTARFGKVLVLDGVVQTTQKDEFIYHEMLTHPFMLSHPKPEAALVIGAGDGGVLRELLKYRSLKKVVLVEIDGAVIDVAKKHLRSICQDAFSDKRVELLIEDGAKYVRQTQQLFDLVIVDSTDPVGPAQVLFSRAFYADIYRILRKDGIMVRQTGSSFLQPLEIRDSFRILTDVFSEVLPMVAAIPTYVGGFFNFLVSAKGRTPLDVAFPTLNKRYDALRLQTKYYNPEMHFACFALPNYIKEVLE
ncbi:MAG: polyamine aminopropyltransferase [Candidatus Omnitrophica bacterium]|nr:polyamine aminopropyltransferase [Candidatus Omnitrophota bacterium]